MNPNCDVLRQRVAAGDEVAFRQLFELYSDRVFGIAFNYMKSSQLAEEAVQDIFLKIWTKRENLPAIDKLPDYIFIIARNHTLNLLRGIAREKIFLVDHQGMFDTQIPAPEPECPQEESWLILEEAELRLPPRQRIIFQLNQRQGLKLSDVAVKLNLSRNTVRNHLFRAMLFIKEYVRKHDSETGLFSLLIGIEIFFISTGTLSFFRGLYY